MNAKELKDMAFALAASFPPYLDQPTIPPLDWHQDGEIITVIMADGRKVKASIQDINKLMFDQNVYPSHLPAQQSPPSASVVPIPKKKEVKPKKSVTKVPGSLGKK